MIRTRVIKGTAVISGGLMAGRICTFGRNIILARMLGPENFGIGALFAITVSMLEMTSDLSVGQLLIQAKDGDKPEHQYTAQTFTFVRGVILGLLILAGAPLIARAFNVPEATWAFRWLAAVPLIRGTFNLDILRLQRDMRYGPDASSFFLSELVAFLAAYPVAVAVNDYSAVLWVVIIQLSVWTVLTHLFAKRRYRLGIDRAFFGRMISFGWPLIIDGLLLFGIMQGDKLLVATTYTKEQLGLYAAATMLTMIPATMLARIARSIALPLLSSAHTEQAKYATRYSMVSSGLGVISALFGAGFSLLGAWVIVLAYGSQFAGAAAVVAWLGVAQAIRILRIAPTTASMARADTRTMMYANSVRLTLLAPAVMAALGGAELAVIAMWAVVGEAMALVVMLEMVRRRQGLKAGMLWAPALVVAVAIAGTWTAAPWCGVWLAALVVMPLVGIIVGLAMLVATPAWRDELARLWSHGPFARKPGSQA